jgi:hypothetical protein
MAIGASIGLNKFRELRQGATRDELMENIEITIRRGH